mgnify:CR=1 FL=1
MSQRLVKGHFGEQLASNYLARKGYQIISANFHSRYGEIDLVATYKNKLIFIEVKTRLNTKFGTPQEAVNYFKLKSLTKTAQYFKLLHPKLPESMQIDVVAIRLDENEKPVSIEHLENVTG